jgi:hypothetical protein
MVQLCGDAHLMNFGFFASPERSLLFDVNDFDETHPGPFEWDLVRLAKQDQPGSAGLPCGLTPEPWPSSLRCPACRCGYGGVTAGRRGPADPS